ncbi:MAG: glycosyltransferase [Cyclobacteriaceae bacterium]|nr:glycosyltransferase [Cyclobacteriaceae bacterium]
MVCAHDEEANLRELVPLLLVQNYSQFEVIIVEDRSNDGTYDYLLDAVKKDDRLKMVRVQHLPEHLNGKKFALTLGIKAAAHEWVLLTDADCRPASREWIKSVASHMDERHQFVIGYSPYVKLPGYLNSFIRFESLITALQFIGWALLHRPYMGTGRNLAYRKSLFLASKGFNKHVGITGGDDDLFVNEHANPLNTAVSIGPDALTRSIPKKTWSDFFYQKIRHLSVGKKYKAADKAVLGVFSSTWVLCWVMVAPIMILPAGVLNFIWVGFVLRELMLVTLVYRGSRTLGEAFEAWKTPVLDFNYAIYYLGTGLMALLSKRVRWKKN